MRKVRLPARRVLRPSLVDERPEFGIEGWREGSFRIEWDAPVPLDLEAIAGWAERCWNLFEGLVRDAP